MSGSLILRGGRAWDGVRGTSAEADVVIDEGRIASIGRDAGAGRSIDVSGCTVMPGLIEGHAHLCFNARSDWRAVYDGDSPGRTLLRMAANGRRMLEAGITTVRDLGSPTALAIEMREAFASGLILGPNLLVSGAPITTTGGHCYFMGGEADGELEIRKGVRNRVKAEVDWIKVMATGGNMTRGTNTLARSTRSRSSRPASKKLIGCAGRSQRTATAPKGSGWRLRPALTCLSTVRSAAEAATTTTRGWWQRLLPRGSRFRRQ